VHSGEAPSAEIDYSSCIAIGISKLLLLVNFAGVIFSLLVNSSFLVLDVATQGNSRRCNLTGTIFNLWFIPNKFQLSWSILFKRQLKLYIQLLRFRGGKS